MILRDIQAKSGMVGNYACVAALVMILLIYKYMQSSIGKSHASGVF